MNVLTVSQLNFYIKTILDDDRNLRSVYLKGEISNFTDHYRSGHLYFSLKDENAVVKSVMFSRYASRLRFRPEDGMKVIVRGSVSIYPQTGQYQLYVEDMQPDGIGELAVAFEQLKKKLAAEGLFDEAHKKPLPEYPRRIGVITSPTGDAVKDITQILARRYPIGEIVFCPVLVQGDSAAADMIRAVRRFDRLRCADIIIIGRGGGSMEDLWAFNDEGLARAVYECDIPVISAVGHENDYTICDFVADLRAATPSMAAEKASPEEGEIFERISFLRERMSGSMRTRLFMERSRLDSLSKARVLRSPHELLERKRMRLDMLNNSMNSAYRAGIDRRKHRFTAAASGLDALSPLRVLARGYSVVYHDKKVITSVGQVNCGDNIQIRLTDGSLDCTVERKNTGNEEA